MRRNGQEYIAKLQGAGARKTEILQRLKERHDATQGWVRKEYENLARGLNAAYAEKIKMIRENEWNRYTLVLELEGVLKQYETKVTDHEEYLKTAGSMYYRKTQSAWKQYEMSRKPVFGEDSRDLRDRVAEAKQQLRQAEADEVRSGVRQVETQVATKKRETAQKRAEATAAETDAKAAEKSVKDAKDLQEKVAENDATLKGLKDEFKELDATKIPAAETAYNNAVRDAKFGGISDPEKANLIKNLEDKTTAEMENVRTRVAPYNIPGYNNPAKQKAKIDELKKTFDDQKTLIEAVQTKKKEWEDLKKTKADFEDPANGKIQMLETQVGFDKNTILRIPILEKMAQTARGNVKPLEEEAKNLEGELKKMEKKLSELQKPKKTAQKALDDAKARLAEAQKSFKLPAVIENQRREFVAQADATLRTINMEGFHLQNQFEGRTARMNARIVFLRRQRTEILEDLVRERGLNADRDTVRALLDNIHFEKQYLLRYGHDDARLTHLNDLETEWAGKMWKIVKKETDDILSPARPGAPEEQERIIKQELKFLAEYPQDPAGATRIAELTMQEVGKPAGKLQEVWDRMHAPLAVETDDALVFVQKEKTVPLIQDAIQKIQTEGSFLWQRGYKPDRVQILKNALSAMQGLLAEAGVREARQETDKSVGKGTHLDRMSYVEKMQAERAVLAETKLDSKRMGQLEKDITTEEVTIQNQLLKQGTDVLASGDAGKIRTVIDATVQAKRFFAADRTPESKNRAMTMVSQLQALRESLADVTNKACGRMQTDVSKLTVQEAVRLTREEFQLLRKYSELEEGDYGSNRRRELRRMFNEVLISLDNAIGIKDAKTLGAMDTPEAERLLALIETDLEVRSAMVPAWRNNSWWEGELMRMQTALEKKKS